MERVRNWLKNKKTYLVGVAAILGAVVGFAEGEIELPALAAAITAAVIAMCMRAAVAKVQNGL